MSFVHPRRECRSDRLRMVRSQVAERTFELLVPGGGHGCVLTFCSVRATDIEEDAFQLQLQRWIERRRCRERRDRRALAELHPPSPEGRAALASAPPSALASSSASC